MLIDMKTAGRTALAGAAGAIVLIVANGLNYFVQDVLLKVLSLGWGVESTIATLGDFARYPLSVVVGLAISMLAVWLYRQATLKLHQVVVLSAVSGLVLGFIGLFARIGYELVIRPILGGYTLSPLNALIVMLNSCTDIAMLTGLAIACRAICAASAEVLSDFIKKGCRQKLPAVQFIYWDTVSVRSASLGPYT